jgi:hypothetical protein
MPLPNLPSWTWMAGPTALSESMTPAELEVVRVSMIHEVGWDLTGGVLRPPGCLAPPAGRSLSRSYRKW